MSLDTTPTRWSQRLHQIRSLFDRVLSNNPFASKLPALHASDYDYYLKSVLDANPLHRGKITYKGHEITKMGPVKYNNG